VSLFVKICRRSLNFIKLCICNGSSLVRAAFNTAGTIHYLVITCICVYNYITVVLKTLLAVRLFAFFNEYASKLVNDYQLQTASFVRNIVLMREDTLELSNRVRLSRLELDQLIIIIIIISSLKMKCRMKMSEEI